jgi:hypothetical protein
LKFVVPLFTNSSKSSSPGTGAPYDTIFTRRARNNC